LLSQPRPESVKEGSHWYDLLPSFLFVSLVTSFSLTEKDEKIESSKIAVSRIVVCSFASSLVCHFKEREIDTLKQETKG
jgi:hypothetical protein